MWRGADLDSLVWLAQSGQARGGSLGQWRGTLVRLGSVALVCAIFLIALGMSGARVSSVAAEPTPTMVISMARQAANTPTPTPPASLSKWARPTLAPTSTPEPTATMIPLRVLFSLPWPLPLRNAKLTQGFDAVHPAWDLGGMIGSAVFAVFEGTVKFADWNGDGYGYLVKIDHGGGLETWYAHLQYVTVREGQWVRANDQLGVMGGTGNSKGWHLHFEVRENGAPVNPAGYLLGQ